MKIHCSETSLIVTVQVVLRDLAKIHSVYLGDSEWLDSKEWLERKETNKTVEMSPLWRELLRHAHSEFPEFWPKDRYYTENTLMEKYSVLYVSECNCWTKLSVAYKRL